MADLAFTNTAIKDLSVLKVDGSWEEFPGVCSVDMLPGTPIYIDANGKLAIADANGSGNDKYRGLVWYRANANQGVSVMRRGIVTDYDVSGLAFDALVYVSNTAGKLSTTAGSTSLAVARVIAIPDFESIKKALYFFSGFVG